MNKEKPPLLSEKKLIEIIQPIFESSLNNGVTPTNWGMAVKKIGKAFSLANKKGIVAQRDADVAYYEPLIQQAKDDSWSNGNTAGVLQGDRRVVKAIQQAKEEVAREIFEEIDSKFLLIARPFTERRDIIVEQPKEWQALKDKHLKDKSL